MAKWSVTYGGKADSELRIAYGADADSPQCAVLHTRDSYLRLSYGRDCAWGTSIVTMPIYWSGGKNHQGVRVNVEWATQGDNLVLTSTGTSKKLEIYEVITLQPPSDQAMVVKVEARTSGTLHLDDRPGEAFKPVFLSSMHISDLDWDCRSVFISDETICFPRSGFFVTPSPVRYATTFGLNGGTSRWKKNSPTVTFELEEPMQIAGWVSGSRKVSSDNVGLWAASERVLPAWAYTIAASGDLDGSRRRSGI